MRNARRRVFGHFPFPVLCSDVRDVIYANWLVPIERLTPHIAGGVEIFAAEGEALLTVLTYRHGHFGPAAAGSFRRLWPSPLQSNWRAYVARIDGEAPGTPTVLFVRNIFDSMIYTLTTRLFSDALPSHLAARFHFAVTVEGIAIDIDGGNGSAPAMKLDVASSAQMTIPPQFDRLGLPADELVATICLQGAALAETDAGLAEAWIDLPIVVGTVEPLEVRHYQPGALLTELGATEAPWCFRVPAAPFTVLGERLVRPSKA